MQWWEKHSHPPALKATTLSTQRTALRVEAIELRRADQAVEGCGTFAARIRTCADVARQAGACHDRVADA